MNWSYLGRRWRGDELRAEPLVGLLAAHDAQLLQLNGFHKTAEAARIAREVADAEVELSDVDPIRDHHSME